MKKRHFIKARLESFKYAVVGLRDILKTEHNAWVHSVCTLGVMAMALWLRIDSQSLMLIVIVISLVWITEAFNTVFELVIDIVSPEYSETARRAKDIAAAAVLFAALTAFFAGIMILGPPLWARLGP